MNTKRFLMFLLVSALVVGIVGLAPAQNKRVGTAAAPELLIPVGARDFAMAGSNLATAYGLEAVHWNPAGLGRLTYSAEALFSSMSYIADIGVTYGGVAAKVGEVGVVALTVKSLDFGDINITTNDDPDGLGGRMFSPTYVTVGLSFARGLTDAISAGGSVKLISEQIDRVSASGVAFDFGVQYDGLGSVQGLSMGVAVKNIGSQMKFDGSGLLRNATATEGLRPTQKYKSEAASFELPSTIEIGLSYKRNLAENLDGVVNGAFVNNNLYLDEYRLGAEVMYKLAWVDLFGRLGLATVPKNQNDELEDIFGPTFGLGLKTNAGGIDIMLDYAYRSVDLFDANQVFALKFGF